MSEDVSNENEIYEIVIRASPIDEESLELVREYFADQDVSHSHAFTGTEMVTVIGKFTTSTLQKAIAWFSHHERRFANASFELDGNKITIKGYALDEVAELLKSGDVQKIIRELKRK
jgi:hypothetical protein